MKHLIIFFGLISFACKTDKKYHDVEVAQQERAVQIDALVGILEFQKELNEEFKNPETSPLPDRYRKNFESLDFFEPDTSLVIKAKFERTPNALPFMMPTTTERKSEEVIYAIATFKLNGVDYSLEIYQSPELIKEEEYVNYLFLPFIDDTNGIETYGGGRYIDLAIPEGDTIVVDFNRAYNPYCAYNKKYSCPIVPGINTINTKVLAGVKAFNK